MSPLTNTGACLWKNKLHLNPTSLTPIHQPIIVRESKIAQVNRWENAVQQVIIGGANFHEMLKCALEQNVRGYNFYRTVHYKQRKRSVKVTGRSTLSNRASEAKSVGVQRTKL